MKIGELDMRCGNCSIIDYCCEPYSIICICGETRFENIEEDEFIKLAKTSEKSSKRAIINDVYKKIKK